MRRGCLVEHGEGLAGPGVRRATEGRGRGRHGFAVGGSSDPEIRAVAVGQASLLDKGGDQHSPTGAGRPVECGWIQRRAACLADIPSGKPLFGRLMGKQSQPQLPQVAQARCSPCRLAGRLHRRQKQADERADDRDHDEQFDEAETGKPARTSRPAAGFRRDRTHGPTFLISQNFCFESSNSKDKAVNGTSTSA